VIADLFAIIASLKNRIFDDYTGGGYSVAVALIDPALVNPPHGKF
jgi:hypothetical protein